MTVYTTYLHRSLDISPKKAQRRSTGYIWQTYGRTYKENVVNVADSFAYASPDETPTRSPCVSVAM